MFLSFMSGEEKKFNPLVFGGKKIYYFHSCGQSMFSSLLSQALYRAPAEV